MPASPATASPVPATSTRGQGSEQWGLVATPSVEIGTRIDLDATYTMRAYARAGVSLATQDSWTTDASLSSAPAGTGPFQSKVPMDSAIGRLGAGIQLQAGERLSFGVEYQGELSSKTTSNAGSLRLDLAF